MGWGAALVGDPHGRPSPADGAVMARTPRFADEVGRFNRWVHTTPRATEATQLTVAVILALLILGAISLVTDIGRWGLVLAALPLAAQGWQLIQATNDRRSDGPTDLPAGSLAGADLTGADLAGRDLSRRDLSDARLTSADLVGADLSGASVADARLRRVDLSYGSLEGADCTKASFFHGRLVETDLRRVDARRAGFERADLRGAHLMGANLLGAAFSGADVRGADFTGAKLAPDALTDAVVDDTTILADGTAADPVGVSLFARLVPSAGLLLTGALWSVARPAFHGLAWASLLTGAVVAVETSGGGLGDELAIMTRTEPVVVGGGLGGGDVRRAPSQQASSGASTGTLPDLDDIDTSGSSSGDTELVPPPGTDPDDDADADGGTSDAIGTATGDDATTGSGAADRDLDGGSILSEAGTVPGQAAAQADPGTSTPDADDPTPATTATTAPAQPEEPELDPADSTTSVPAELTEVEVPVTSALAGLRQVRMVVSSDGGASTVTSASSLGQLEPRVVDGQDGWELPLPSGQVQLLVTPNGAEVATACQILVDGVERSFQSGLAGQTSTCAVDLDPVG